MSRLSITLEVDSPEQERLLRQYHAFLQEMEALALAAPEGQVLDACETAVLQKGQEVNRQVLEQAVQKRIDAAEKKGRRSAPAAAAGPARTAARPRGRS
jgi:hypothetical protein